jgi:MFS family permease
MDKPAQTTSDAPARQPVLKPGWRQTFHALRYRNFRLLWLTTVMVAGGVWLQQVTLGWLAYDLTGSPVQVGAILGARAAPLLFAPVAGVLADRFDRRNLLVADQILVTALVFGFAAILLLDIVEIWHVYVFALSFGTLWAINNPVRQTLVANTVPREVLMNAMALNSMAFNLMRAIGPLIGGFLIAFFGPGINFLLQGLVFGLALIMIVPLRTEYGVSNRAAARGESAARNLIGGFRYVWEHPTTLATMLVTILLTVAVLGLVFSQMPVYAAEVLLDTEGDVLGLLLMAAGVGGFIGTLLIARFSHYERKGLQSLVAFVGSAVGLIAVSQVSVLAGAMVLLAIQQMFIQIVMTTNLTIVQATTPDEMRGRVTGVYQMEIGFMPFSGVLAGVIASQYGISTAFLAGGISGLVLVALIVAFMPHFTRLRL